MAQRENQETEVQITETLTLCVNNCGFYGNPATKNMCQSCFKSSTTGPGVTGVSSSSSRPSGSEREKVARSKPIGSSSSAAAAAAVRGRERGAEVGVRSEEGKVRVNRCSGCGKRVGLTGFRCRCGDLFCGEHRYSDRHDCSFDYKAVGREAIARENPVVRAAKIVRV